MGTNISGDFACRAPKGACAPSSAVDAEAVRALTHDAPVPPSMPRTPVAVADTDRTAERKLRIVFPAYVDASGTLHEASIAWAIVEAPRWASALRTPQTASDGGFAGRLKRALKARVPASAPVPLIPEDSPLSAPLFSNPAAPLSLPSPGGAADTGAGPATPAPGAEGSDRTLPPPVRTPRPLSDTPTALEPQG